MAAKASSVGAKTVNGPSPCSTETSSESATSSTASPPGSARVGGVLQSLGDHDGTHAAVTSEARDLQQSLSALQKELESLSQALPSTRNMGGTGPGGGSSFVSGNIVNDNPGPASRLVDSAQKGKASSSRSRNWADAWQNLVGDSVSDCSDSRRSIIHRGS